MKINTDEQSGLFPVIIQDEITREVLMLGYMNDEALGQTKQTGRVTFFSRSRQQLWVKGETSGNFLLVKNILADCDQDTLLILVQPAGPACHMGTRSCFGEEKAAGFVLPLLEQTIAQRIAGKTSGSYTSTLYQKGARKVAQKVGEEAVELVIEALRDDRELFAAEAADLLYHYLLLLQCKGLRLADVEAVLRSRMG